MGYVQFSQAKMKEIYGASESAVRKQLVKAELDFGANAVKMSVHKKIKDLVEAVCTDYRAKVEAGKAPAYKLHPNDCYAMCWRTMRGGNALSMHSWATALDINAYNPNGYGVGAKSNIPEELWKSFNKYGFYWGGHWSSPRDPMHFEYAPLSFPKAKNKAKPKAKKYKAGQVVTTTAKLNLRAKPSTSGAIKKTYRKGKKLKVVKDLGSWLQVKGGYIHEDYVKIA